MLAESMSPIRRIFTDGRDFPKDERYPQFVGYSVGKWLDTDNDGTYDTLEVETRNMRGPRLMESTGIPLHADNETIVKEKLYLDKDDEHPAQRDHDHRSRLHQALDGVAVLSPRSRIRSTSNTTALKTTAGS